MAAMPRATCRKDGLGLFAAMQQNWGDGMLESFQPKPEQEGDRQSGGWRAVLSAWAFVLLLVILFAGTQALASHRAVAPRHAKLAGAVIPRHDAASAGVGVPCAARLDECGKVATALVQGLPYAYPGW
jgi:hypothetical protein